MERCNQILTWITLGSQVWVGMDGLGEFINALSIHLHMAFQVIGSTSNSCISSLTDKVLCASTIHSRIHLKNTYWIFIISQALSQAWKWNWLSHVQLFETLWTIYIVHGIFQARILEQVAFSFSRVSSQPRNQTQVSNIAGRFFTSWATREIQEYWCG